MLVSEYFPWHPLTLLSCCLERDTGQISTQALSHPVLQVLPPWSVLPSPFSLSRYWVSSSPINEFHFPPKTHLPPLCADGVSSPLSVITWPGWLVYFLFPISTTSEDKQGTHFLPVKRERWRGEGGGEANEKNLTSKQPSLTEQVHVMTLDTSFNEEPVN